MSENTQTTGGAGGGNGGAGTGSAGADSAQNSNNNSGNSPKMVSWEVHDRVMGDLAKAKDKARELETRLGDLESKSLIEKKDFESLYNSEKQKREAAEGRLKETGDWIVRTQQFNAVKTEALAAGLRKEALDDLDLIEMKGVDVETTSTGRFIVKGAKERVESLKQEKPHWFTAANPPTVNAGGTGAGETKTGTRLSVNDVIQAERDFKRGRISRQQYNQIYSRYCKENPKNAIPMGEPQQQQPQTQK